MHSPNLFILYVSDPTKSAAFYAELFNQAPIYQTETYIMFQFDSGWQLGMWVIDEVDPKAQAVSQCTEMAIAMNSQQAVDDTYQYLQTEGIEIIQSPKQLDFGYALTGLDRDGHRFRIYHRTEQQQ